MGPGHAHRRPDGSVPVSPTARIVVLALLLCAGVATLVGLVALWPGSATAQDGSSAYAAPGVSFPHAEVTRVTAGCDAASAADPAQSACSEIHATVTTGASRGTEIQLTVPTQVGASGLSSGDSIQVVRVPAQAGAPDVYQFFAVDRSSGLALLFGAFVLVVVLVARLRGLLAVVGLGIAGLVVTRFMLPALLAGHSGVLVALVSASAIMVVVLYLAHGLSMRTSAALLGTLCGVALTAVLAEYVVQANRLSGLDETAQLLAGIHPDLDFQGLLSCAVILAGLGVLNDVTITQASAVWELRGAAPDLTRGSLFARAMRIGRDHIASTIYTIVFAYAGASLTVLMLIRIYDRPLLEVLGTEEIATEVVRTLTTAIGLVLAVPITTAIAAALTPPHPTPASRSEAGDALG
jgi:uncharacterized membrane protein